MALELSHQRINASLSEVESEAETLQKTRPPFLFLHSKTVRSTFNNQLSSAGESLAALTTGLEKIERLRPMLHAWVEDELETHLRTRHLGYVRGLATHRYPEDWERYGRRFGMRVQRFTEFLHNLRASLSKLPAEMITESDPTLSDLYSRAAKVGAAVDAEVTFFNHLADVQRGAVAPDPGTMRRQLALSCETNVNWLRSLPVGQALRGLSDFLANYQVQIQQVRVAIVSEGNLSLPDGPKAVRGFVLPQWESLRKMVRLELDPDAIGLLVADTEKLLEGHL